MNEKIQNAIKTTKGFITKHSPEILTSLGIASMITSTVLAVKATPKAVSLLQKEENKNALEGNEIKMDFFKKFKVVWKEYIPAASFGVGVLYADVI